MTQQDTKRWTIVAAAFGLGVALATGGAALAFTDGATYTGCLNGGGNIANVAIGDEPARPCRGNSVEISWNAEGRPGSPGAAGPPGPVGPPGPPGVGLPEGCVVGDIVQWNASEWVCVDPGTAIEALEARVAELEALLVAVAYNGATQTLMVAGNLQVVNGTGTTSGTPNGLGNVIIGYNTDIGNDVRGGSHYLVVGDGHTYTRHSGIVAGSNNAATGFFGSVVGGANNTGSGDMSFVGGGLRNIASGTDSFVGGGNDNVARGIDAFVAGGDSNAANNTDAFVGGGFGNTASGTYSFVGGGFGNKATGFEAFVGGGFLNAATGVRSFVGGGSFRAAGPSTCAWIANLNVVPC